MIFMNTEDEYSYYCNFKGCLAKELEKKYSPNPWVFQDAVQYRDMEQHYTVNFRNFDNSRHLSVDVTYSDGAYHYTFSEE